MNIDADVNKIAGGLGCDTVINAGEFTARIGRIYAIVSNADDSRILNITENNVVISGRTYMSRKRLERITLAGTSGSCTIIVDGVTAVCTWDAGGLAATAAAFVTANAATWAAAGTTLTSDGATLLFESLLTGVGFEGESSGANASGDLVGTVEVLLANFAFPIDNGKIIIPDVPASKFTLAKGSFFVYYTL